MHYTWFGWYLAQVSVVIIGRFELKLYAHRVSAAFAAPNWPLAQVIYATGTT